MSILKSRRFMLRFHCFGMRHLVMQTLHFINLLMDGTHYVLVGHFRDTAIF